MSKNRNLFNGINFKFPSNEDGTFSFPTEKGVKDKLNELVTSVQSIDTRLDQKPLIYPLPAKAESHLFSAEEGGGYEVDGKALHPLWMANYNESVEIIARAETTALWRSTDNGETWTEILKNSAFLQIYGVISTPPPHESVLIAARDVAGTQHATAWFRSEILDNSDTVNWTKVAEASAGHFTSRYGRSIWDNVIIFSTYGDKNADNPPRFIYISTDYGKNFREVEAVKISEMGDPSAFHIHDVEYDPWGSRIWISTGDTSANSAVWYSDDWGESFNEVITEPRMQPTSITALPDRVIFGSDDVPDGLRVWYRDFSARSKPVNSEDIKMLYMLDHEGIERRPEEPIVAVANIFHSPTSNQIDSYPYNLISFFTWYGDPKYPNRLLASPDGERWFEIFRIDGELAGGSSSRVMGPVSNDPEKKIFYLHFHPSVGQVYYRLKMPKWVITQ